MNTKNISIVLVLIVIFATAGFFAGTKYQQSKTSSFNKFNSTKSNSVQAQQKSRTSFRPVAGEIISSDAKSITVKLQDGSSKIVVLSDKTAINKTNPATSADLAVGQTVSVFGQDNSDGSVTAQNIQLNPISRNSIPSVSPTKNPSY